MNARRRRFAKQRRRFERRVERWDSRWKDVPGGEHALACSAKGVTMIVREWCREGEAVLRTLMQRRLARALGFTR